MGLRQFPYRKGITKRYCVNVRFLHCTNSRTPKSITKRRYSFASPTYLHFGRHADAKQGCDLDHPYDDSLGEVIFQAIQIGENYEVAL